MHTFIHTFIMSSHNWSNLFLVMYENLLSGIKFRKFSNQRETSRGLSQSTFEEYITLQHTNKFSKYVYAIHEQAY